MIDALVWVVWWQRKPQGWTRAMTTTTLRVARRFVEKHPDMVLRLERDGPPPHTPERPGALARPQRIITGETA